MDYRPTRSSGQTVGQVTSLSPMEVRMWGDSVDTPIGLIDSTVSGSIATNDKVGLIKFGSNWAIISILEAT